MVIRRLLMLHDRFKAWKPIHLCWWFRKHNLPIPPYLIGSGSPSTYQRYFKFGTDSGNADPDSQTWGTQNANLTNQAKETPFFLRFAISNEGTWATGNDNWQLYFNTTNNPGGASPVTTSSNVVRIVDDPGSNITNHASNDDSSVLTTTGSYDNGGEYVDGSDETGKHVLDDGYTMDVCFCIQFQSDATGGQTYYFWIFEDSGQLDNYTVVPTATVTTATVETKTFTTDAYLKKAQTKTFTCDAFLCLEKTAYIDCADDNDATMDSDAPACNAQGEDYKCGTASQDITYYEDESDSGINICYDESGGTSTITEGLGADELHGPAPIFPASGDAKKYFGKTVNVGKITYITTEVDGTIGVINLTGLNNSKKYTITVLGMRGNYTNRWTEYELNDYGAFTADHSVGTISGGTPTGKTCRYVAGDNWSNGYVARWKDVTPGGDGDLQITFKGVAQGGDSVNKGYLSAMIITEQQVVTYTKTFTADAYLASSNTKSFSADAFLGETETKTFTVDAYLASSETKTFTADAYLSKTGTKSFTCDAYLQKAGETKTFTSDAWLATRETKAFTCDAWLATQPTKTFTCDAWLAGTGTKTFTTDAMLQSSGTKSFTCDAYLVKQYDKSFTADAILQKVLAKNFTCDAILQDTFTKTFTGDAWLGVQYTKTFTADSYLQDTYTKTFTCDAILSTGAATKTFTVDAYLEKTQIKEFTSDSYLQTNYTKTFSVDSFLAGVFSKSYTSDAYLKAVQTKAFTSDAYLSKTGTKTFTCDAYLQKAGVKNFTADSYLKAEQQVKTFTCDAILASQSQPTKDFTADAYLQKPYVKTFSIDAMLQKQGLTKEFSCDAVLMQEGAASSAHSVSFKVGAWLVDRTKHGYKHMGAWQDPENMGVWKGSSWAFGELDGIPASEVLLDATRSQQPELSGSVDTESYMSGTPDSESYLSGTPDSYPKYDGNPGGYIRGTL